VRVSHRKALGYPAVWRAVSLISGDVAKLPLLVYRQNGKNKEPDAKHPAYRVLLRKPNDAMTAFVFKQTLMLHVLTRGNGYAYIDRAANGDVVALLLLDPGAVEPVRVGGVLWYLYRPPGGEWRKLPADDVLHVKGMGYDGLQGYPVLSIAREALGAAIAARDHSARYFANGARPGGVLEHPGKLLDAAIRNLRESWERIHRGLDNAHKIAILQEGVKYVAFNSNARDAQLLETREFDAREVANIFGVPTHKLGDPSKVAYNSLGEENQSYYDDTLSRWLHVFAEEAHDKVLTDKEKAAESHSVDFDYHEIQRANLPQQVDYAQKLTQAGIIDVNEARAVFGMNPRANPEPVPQPTPQPARGAALDGVRAVVADTFGRMARRIATHANKLIDAERVIWLRGEGKREEHGAFVTDAVSPLVALCRGFGLEVPEAAGVADLLFRAIEGAMPSQQLDPNYIRDRAVAALLKG
jgi:HK97 family phage portal protein